MQKDKLSFLKGLYNLWRPVFPYFSYFVKELYRRKEGNVIEIGPFCGSIFSLYLEGIGSGHFIASFLEGMAEFYREEVKNLGLQDNIFVIETTDTLSCVKDEAIDLVVFRGAFFFPGLFNIDYCSIYRIMKRGGVAIIGGGFGKYTPVELIEKIKKRSKELNFLVGKVNLSDSELMEKIIPKSLSDYIEITTEGGLWTIMRK